MNLLTISLGRHILEKGSREYMRMQMYATHFDAMHIVVLTRHTHGYVDAIHEGNLHIYPTHARTRIQMLCAAFLISRRIIKETPGSFTVSAQDPLEIGWLSYFISLTTRALLHIQVHGDYFSSNAWVGTSLIRRLRRMFALTLLRTAPRIRVVSERIKSSLVSRGVKAERITVLPIRPELEAFLQVSYTPRTHGPYTFLYIGRLAPEKNILRIVEAFTSLCQTYTIRLRIVGGGEELSSIERFIRDHHVEEKVELIPWTTDVPLEMARADVFVLASLHEAYALTLVEAMAAGLPIVTTDVGCVGEIVEDNVHALVVREAGVAVYAAAMRRMIEEPLLRAHFSETNKRTAHTLAQMSPQTYTQLWAASILAGVSPVGK